MTTSSHSNCDLDIIPVNPWFQLRSISVEFPRNLIPAKFARFDYALDFAGRSRRGISLSVRNSAGPAKVGPYLICAEPPPGWLAFSWNSVGLLLNSDHPRLAFIGPPQWNSWEAFALPREDVAEVIEIAESCKFPAGTRQSFLSQLTPKMVPLLARYRHQLKVIFVGSQPHLRAAKDLQLRPDEWNQFSRHVFTGAPRAGLENTVPFEQDNLRLRERVKLQGRSLPTVMAAWGVQAERPVSFDGTNLGFRSFRVVDPLRLSRVYPGANLLVGKRLRVIESSNYTGAYKLPLAGAAAAGVIPDDPDLHVNAALDRIFLSTTQVRSVELKQPLQIREESWWHRPLLLCPESLVDTHLLTASRAARMYRLPPGIKNYEVQAISREGWNETALPGTFYLVSDLSNLPRRNLRQEREDRVQRRKRLIALYGRDLPTDFERFTDDQLSTFQTLKQRLARGEIQRAKSHPQLPHARYHREQFLDWLKKASDLVITCPVTGEVYLRPVGSIDDLAGLPSFWPTVEALLGESSWLRTLILSPTVRAAAVAHAI